MRREVIGGLIACLMAGPICRADDEVDPAARVERILANAESAGLWMTEPDAGETALRLQDDILADLDALIELAERPPPPSSGSDSPPSPDETPMPGAGSNGRSRPEPGPARPGVGQPGGAGETSPPPSRADRPTERRPGGSSAVGEPTAGMPDDLNAFERGVWGHLPEKLRRDLDTYYHDRFIPEYGDLLRQYYSSIAEAGRR